MGFDWVGGWYLPRMGIEQIVKYLKSYYRDFNKQPTKAALIPNTYDESMYRNVYFYSFLFNTYLKKNNNGFDLPFYTSRYDPNIDPPYFSYQITFYNMLNPLHGLEYLFELKSVRHREVDFLFPKEIEKYLSIVYGEDYMTPYIDNYDYCRTVNIL